MDKCKILVVDDESRMRKLVSDFLTKQGYEVLDVYKRQAEDIFYRPSHEYTKGLLRSIPNVDRIGEKLDVYKRQW